MRSDQLPSVNNSAAEDLRKNKIKCVSFLSVLFVLLVGIVALVGGLQHFIRKEKEQSLVENGKG